MADLTLKEFSAYLDQTAKLLGHYDGSAILDKLRAKLARSVEANFKGRHSPEGIPWAGRATLMRSGDLRASAIESAWHSLAEGGTLAIDTSLLPGYWAYQQFGTRRIPARPFVGIPEALVNEAVELLAEDVVGKMAHP